jgi:hypothetical protein
MDTVESGIGDREIDLHTKRDIPAQKDTKIKREKERNAQRERERAREMGRESEREKERVNKHHQ